jgi:hypothetical protein
MMTKPKRRSNPAFWPAAIALVLAASGGVTGPGFVEEVRQRLGQFNQQFPREQTYVVTDRFVYRPGEDVWFQGYVISGSGMPVDSGSNDFYIRLINGKGEEVISRRYPVKEKMVSGRFLIPRTAIPGKYYLVAYSGWMRNQPSSEAFRKEILVGKYFDKRFRAAALFDRMYYYPGDTLNLGLHFTDPAGKPLTFTEFGYRIGSFSKVVERGTGKTDGNGNSRLNLPLPSVDGVPVLTLELKSRRINSEYAILIPASEEAPEITFYPEGGTLVAGLPGVIAVRCKSKYGIPAGFEGDIVSRDGTHLAKARSSVNGYGLFSFTPGTDTCFLQITKPAGVQSRIPLPPATIRGTVLHFEGLRNDSAVFVLRSDTRDGDTTGYLAAVLNDRLVTAGTITYLPEQRLAVPLQGTGGFLQLTLFEKNRDVRAERVVFIPENKVLKVETDRHVYHTRQRVVLTAEYLGTGGGAELSALVSLQQLSLTSLNATIVQHAAAFPLDTLSRYSSSPSDPGDLEVLTSNFRVVRWDEVFGKTKLPPPYRKMDGITGVVTDKKENPAQHAKVRITHIPNFRFYETQTDENGAFNVNFGSDIIDFNYLNIDAYDAMGKVNLTANVNRQYISGIVDGIRASSSGQLQQKINNTALYGDPDVVYSLRYGPRKYRKSDTEIRKRYDPARYTDYSSVIDIIKDIRPCEVVNKTIVFRDTMDYALPAGVQEGAVIVINGALKGTNCEVLNSLLPSDVTNINISNNLVDVHRYTPLNFQGVIELTTIQGMYRYRQPTVQLGLDILNTLREFRSPDYSIENYTGTDSRKTLYWNPRLTVSKDHPALIMFYTSDIRGAYYGRIEGIDRSGKPVVCEFTILVE